MSADSDSNGNAYVAYVAGGTSGTLKIIRFSNTGTFQAVETADSTLSHSLPSIVVGATNNVTIYTLANNKVYLIQRISGTWQAPSNPYGTSFDSPDQLTTGNGNDMAVGTLWREGTTSPYKLKYAGIFESLFGSDRACNFPVNAANPCKRSYIVLWHDTFWGATVKTPATSLFGVSICFDGKGPYLCAKTDWAMTAIPESLDLFGASEPTYHFERGRMWAFSPTDGRTSQVVTWDNTLCVLETCESPPLGTGSVPVLKLIFFNIEVIYDSGEGDEQMLFISLTLTTGYNWF